MAPIFGPNFSGIGGGGVGIGSSGRKVFAAHAVGATLAADASETDTTLTLVDASPVPVGYYWEDNVTVLSVDTSTNVVTLSGAVGYSIVSGATISFVPMAGAGATLTIPLLTEPTQISLWGYLENDAFSSFADWVDSATVHYTAISGDAFRTGAYTPTDDTSGLSRIGAALSVQGGAWGELLYNTETGEVSWATPNEFGTNVPYVFAIAFST